MLTRENEEKVKEYLKPLKGGHYWDYNSYGGFYGMDKTGRINSETARRAETTFGKIISTEEFYQKIGEKVDLLQSFIIF